MAIRYLFATKNDWLDLLTRFEHDNGLAYTLQGHYEQPHPKIFGSVHEIPDLGTVHVDTVSSCPRYMIHPAHIRPVMRKIPQYDGGLVYSLIYTGNPTSIEIQPGGLYKRTFMMAGMVDNLNKTEESISLYRALDRLIRKQFSKYPYAFWLGPEAQQLHRSGMRFITFSTAEQRDADLPAAV